MRCSRFAAEIQATAEIAKTWYIFQTIIIHRCIVNQELNPQTIPTIQIKFNSQINFTIKRNIVIGYIHTFWCSMVINNGTQLNAVFRQTITPAEPDRIFVYANNIKTEAKQLVPIVLFVAMKVISAIVMESY